MNGFARAGIWSVAACGFALGAFGALPSAELVVHEWGTITTVHAADGTPQGGLNKIEPSEVLPAFVHRYEPESTRFDPKKKLMKQAMVPGRPDVTMRLETPVVYFHPPAGSKYDKSIDVTVVFRGGVINEFYPAAEAAVSVDVARINDKGVANVIRRFAPEMVKRKTGVIVNFSSGWGRSVDAEVAPYCATKWAIEGLTQSLAQELPSGMAAIPLNPGIIDTDMLHRSFGNSAKSYPSPTQWAKVAVPFLLALGPDDNGRPLTVPTPEMR